MEFVKKMSELYQLSAGSMELLMENMERISYSKKEIVIAEGQKDDFTYFVEKGSTRGYVYRDGKCCTLFFSFEGDSLTSVLGEAEQRNARFIVETLEDTDLLRISHTRMDLLFKESVELANWGRRFIENKLLSFEHYFIDYYWADKSTQYVNILKEYPELLQRVSLKDLASYLNVTPQSLSRIRSEIKRPL